MLNLNCPNCNSDKKKTSREFVNYKETTCEDCGYIWIEDKQILENFNTHTVKSEPIIGSSLKIKLLSEEEAEDFDKVIGELESLLKPFTFFSFELFDILDPFSDKNDDIRDNEG